MRVARITYCPQGNAVGLLSAIRVPCSARRVSACTKVKLFQRTGEELRQSQTVCCPAVLLVGCISNPHQPALIWLNRLIATEPFLSLTRPNLGIISRASPDGVIVPFVPNGALPFKANKLKKCPAAGRRALQSSSASQSAANPPQKD